MIREVIATGRDANQAIENGCLELGVTREEAEFEIISLPRKSLFGLKTQPAKVRVFVELPDVVRTPRSESPAQRPQQRQEAQKPRQDAQPPRPQNAGQKQPRQERPDAPEGPAKGPRGPKPPAQKQEQKPQRERQPQQERQSFPLPEEIVPSEKVEERVLRAGKYVEQVLLALGITELVITPKYYSESVCLQLEGTGLGVIIGRRGETLDALQYLASLVANRGEGEYLRLNIDSGNYREKREKTLENLARKLANQAIRTGKSTTLEPMNPYERRVIHGAVSQIRGATSSSVGVDPNRRVVISAAAGAKRQPAGREEAPGERKPGNRGRSGGRSRGPGRGGQPRTDGPRDSRSSREPVTTGIVGGVAQDLSEMTESLQVTLKAPPPPSLNKPDAPRNEGFQAAPQPHEETEAREPAAPPAPSAERVPGETVEVEKAPRYGKIEI